MSAGPSIVGLSVARREVLLRAIALYVSWTATWIAYHEAGAIWPEATHRYATWWWLGAKLAVWCVPVWFLIARRGLLPFDWLGLSHLRGLGRGLAGTLVLVVVLMLVDALVPGRWPSRADLATTSLSALVVIAFVSPALEEVLFRGYALHRLTEAGSSYWSANLEAAMLFAVLHVPGWLFQGRSLVECATLGVNIVLLGFVFGAARAGGATLWSSVLVHVANNAWHGGWILLAVDLLTGRGGG